MNEKLKGIIIPAATPFDERGEVSVSMMEHNYQRWGQTGVRGYMCLGSNGEYRSLSDEEALLVIETAGRLKGDKTLIVGAGRESLHQTLAFVKRVMDQGAPVDYLSILTPHYFAKLMDGEALYDYFNAVADFSTIPILIYVAPSFANGVTLPPGIMAKLANHPNIHGVKDTTSNMMVDYMLKAGRREDFAVMAGSLNNIMTCLAFGGPGGVVSAANYFPEECVEITTLFFSGAIDQAYTQYIELQNLVKASGAKYSVAGLKACMNLCGYAGGQPRLPVRPLPAEVLKEIEGVLRQAGKIQE